MCVLNFLTKHEASAWDPPYLHSVAVSEVCIMLCLFVPGEWITCVVGTVRALLNLILPMYWNFISLN
jgi:hypothetical protein